jgi:hypothetical protein
MRNILHGKDNKTDKVQEGKTINLPIESKKPETQLGKDLLAIRQEILDAGETQSEEAIQDYMDDQRRRYLFH